MTSVFEKLCCCCFKNKNVNRIPSNAYKNPIAGNVERGNSKQLKKEAKIAAKNKSVFKSSSFNNKGFEGKEIESNSENSDLEQEQRTKKTELDRDNDNKNQDLENPENSHELLENEQISEKDRLENIKKYSEQPTELTNTDNTRSRPTSMLNSKINDLPKDKETGDETPSKIHINRTNDQLTGNNTNSEANEEDQFGEAEDDKLSPSAQMRRKSLGKSLRGLKSSLRRKDGNKDDISLIDNMEGNENCTINTNASKGGRFKAKIANEKM